MGGDACDLNTYRNNGLTVELKKYVGPTSVGRFLFNRSFGKRNTETVKIYRLFFNDNYLLFTENEFQV